MTKNFPNPQTFAKTVSVCRHLFSCLRSKITPWITWICTYTTSIKKMFSTKLARATTICQTCKTAWLYWSCTDSKLTQRKHQEHYLRSWGHKVPGRTWKDANDDEIVQWVQSRQWKTKPVLYRLRIIFSYK